MFMIITNLAQFDAVALTACGTRTLQVMSAAFRRWQRRRSAKAGSYTTPSTRTSEPETTSLEN
jgi:hypothetical protein